MPENLLTPDKSLKELEKEKKKSKDIYSLNFKSKNYNMRDNYKSSDLVIANLEYVSSAYTPKGPMVERISQKYIFEIIKESRNIRYREIFTGFINEINVPKKVKVKKKHIGQIEVYMNYIDNIFKKNKSG